MSRNQLERAYFSGWIVGFFSSIIMMLLPTLMPYTIPGYIKVAIVLFGFVCIMIIAAIGNYYTYKGRMK